MNDKPDGFGAHMPLPYVVVLRATLSEDGVPQRFEKHVVAYSVYEALLQAIMEAAGSSPEGLKYDLERIEPDVAAYFKLLLGEMYAAAKK